jgi:hypothetical protein
MSAFLIDLAIKLSVSLLIWLIIIQFVMRTNRKISRETRLRWMQWAMPTNYNPKFAEKFLKIKKWKDRVPQMSDWSDNVYDKSSLSDSSIETLRFYLEEFEKGLFAHAYPPVLSVFALVWSFYTFDIGSLSVGISIPVVIINVTGTCLQVMYLTIQRYNYYRFKRVVEFKERKLKKARNAKQKADS